MKASERLRIHVLNGRISQIVISEANKSFLAYSVFDHCRNHVGRKRVLLEDSARRFANQSYYFPSVKEHVFKSDDEVGGVTRVHAMVDNGRLQFSLLQWRVYPQHDSQ
jgi:hypothetical protein